MKHFLIFAICALTVLATAGEPVEIRTAGPERPMVTAGVGKKTVMVGLEGALSGLTVRGEIRKWGEKKITGKIVPVPAKRETELSFELVQPGIYQITFLAERGKEVLAERECTYSALPPLTGDHPAEMGTCTHFAQGKGNIPYTFELLKLAGFTRIRDDLAWGSIEPKPGDYRIRSETERFIDAANRYGIKPLLVTGYCNGGAYPGKFTKAFVTTPEMREAYGNAVAFAVKHFGDRVAE